MKLMSGVTFVSALAFSALSAGGALADCKQTCNTSYADCGASGKDQVQCLTGWRTCKMQCSGAVVSKATPIATSSVPKGGTMQKAAVKH